MKKIIAMILVIIICFFVPVRSYAALGELAPTAPQTTEAAVPDPGTAATRGDQISQQQFDQIMSTLRRMKDYSSGGNYDFCYTGVRCQSAEEAKAVMRGFKELFLADNEFILYYNERRFKRMYVEPQKNNNGKYVYWLCGEGSGSEGIYVVWKPDADANEMLRQHDEAKKVIDMFISSAPQDAYEKVKYYNDVLAGHISYDVEGYRTGNTKHSPYHGLVEKTCVCSGYAESFFNLCYYSGITCAVADCVSVYSSNGVPDHKISMVNLDGRWKEVDVTWNDTDKGVSYDYFMVDMNDTWQHHINGTTPGPAGV